MTPRTAERRPSRAPGSDEALLAEHTQALLDAIAAGEARVWDRLLEGEAVVTDKGGSLLDKRAVVDSIGPHGPRISASITAINLDARVVGLLGVVTYVSDELESYYDQPLHCRYRSTDTWLRRPEGWRLVASQVLALRDDPPSVAVDPAEEAALVGRYALAEDRTISIAAGGAGLVMSESGQTPRPPLAEARDVYFVPGSPRYRYLVERDQQRVVVAIAQRREAWDLRWHRRAEKSRA